MKELMEQEIQERIEAVQPQPDWDIWEMAMDYLETGPGHLGMYPSAMSIMEKMNNVTFDKIPRDLQKPLLEKLAEDDPEEALHYASMFLRKPYGMDIIKKAALKDPDIAVEQIEVHENDSKYKEIQRFLIEALGQKKFEKVVKSLRGNILRRLFVNLASSDSN